MKKILFIDDDETFQKLAHHVTEQAGAKMERAKDAATALAMLALQTYDIVFCDQRLPDMHGVDLIYILSDKYPRTDFYLVTSYPKDALDEDLENLKIKGFINKYDFNTRIEEILNDAT